VALLDELGTTNSDVDRERLHHISFMFCSFFFSLFFFINCNLRHKLRSLVDARASATRAQKSPRSGSISNSLSLNNDALSLNDFQAAFMKVVLFHFFFFFLFFFEDLKEGFI
jgi:hypothetical protein